MPTLAEDLYRTVNSHFARLGAEDAINDLKTNPTNQKPTKQQQKKLHKNNITEL